MRLLALAVFLQCASALVAPRRARTPLSPLKVPSPREAAPRSAPGAPSGDGLASRLAAFRVLEAGDRATTDALLEKHADGLGERDRVFCRALVTAARRNEGAIDATIRALCDRKPKGPTAIALRLGVAQLLYLDGVPDRAAVHTSVELARAFRGSTGFVNAVLRKVDVDARVDAPKPPLYAAIAADFGDAIADRFLETRPPDRLDVTCASAEARDAFLDAVRSRWPKALAVPRGAVGAAVRTPETVPVPDLPGYDEGGWWPQDPAAACAAEVLDAALPRNARVLDACAAPGGKALQLAAAGHDVDALEKSEARSRRLLANLRRCDGGGRVTVVVGDATKTAPAAGAVYDGVLLDAPCSATGTARRRPDVLRKKTADPALAVTQRRLLVAAWAAVRPGGVLVFASCSAVEADAEASVRAFLAAAPDAALDPIAAADLGQAFDGAAFVDGALRVWPWHAPAGCDAHYVARLRKAPGGASS